MQLSTSIRTAAAAAGLLALLPAAPADAVAHTYSATVDLLAVDRTTSPHPWGAGGVQTVFALSGERPTFTLAVGDTISGTITFAEGQRLQFTDPAAGDYLESFSIGFVSAERSVNEYTTRMELLGVAGDVRSNPRPSRRSGHSNVDVFIDDFTKSSVSFTGFSYSATLTYFEDGADRVYRPANLLAVTAAADDVAVVVPEPTAFGALLLLLPFAAGRRRPRPA